MPGLARAFGEGGDQQGQRRGGDHGGGDALDDPEASPNDRFVALDLLKNANIAAGGVLPMCQDTGTAIVMGKRGQHVLTDGDDEEAICARHLRRLHAAEPALLADGAARHVRREEHRHQPAGADRALRRADGDEYHFLFMAKGGGSANKTFLYQETKALLNPTRCWRSSTRRCARSAPRPARRTTWRSSIGGTSRRVHAEDREARQRPLPRHAADDGQRRRPRLPRPRARGRRSSS